AGANDPEPQDFPISEEQINQWKTEAEAGGVINGNVSVPGNGTMNLGPRRINGNLSLGNNARLVVTGRLWVTGNIQTSNNNIIELHNSYGSGSKVVVVDGRIDVNNNAIFRGACSGSYIMMLSESNSLDPNAAAIDVSNNGNGVIFY